ncbi:MAG: hypothetical protein JWL83_3852 [Actinomycetia bacterium]|jgi:hypothetical protein|nr:hypothetical protein [Actinomycetes bacterium]
MHRMPRRAFLGLVGGVVVVGAGAGTWEATRRHGPTAEAPDVHALQRVLGDPAPAARIGKTYLAEKPNAPAGRKGFVLPLLDPAKFPGGEIGMARAAPFDLSTPIRNAARVDCFASRVVELDGWILPQTILDLCAVTERHFG